jgi:hypothetical protein
MKALGRPWVTAVITSAVTLIGCAWVLAPSWRQGFPVDDAWIHMVYGLSLRTDGALAYNPGTASTGCTSLLWTVVTAAAHVLAGARGPSAHAAMLVKALGVALHLVTALLSARLGAAVAPPRLRPHAALAAGLLVGAAPRMLYASGSGMEVPLTTALLVASLLAAATDRVVWAGLLGGLTVTARPEGVLALPALALLTALPARTSGSLAARVARLGAAALVPVAVMLGRTYLASGRPLPATFYAKAGLRGDGALHAMERAVFGVLGGLEPTGHALFAAMVLVALGLGLHASVQLARGRRGPHGLAPRVLLGIVGGVGVAYVLASAVTVVVQLPRHFYFQRYYLPTLPLLIVAAVGATAWCADRAGRRYGGRATRLGLTPLAVAGALVLRGWPEARADFARDVASIDGTQVRIGREVARRLAPDGVVWGVDAGALRYWGGRRTVDLMGLNTWELTRTRRLPRAWAADAVVLVPAIFEARASPGLLVPRLVTDANPHNRQALFECAASPAPGASDIVVVVDRRDAYPLVAGRCRRRPPR